MRLLTNAEDFVAQWAPKMGEPAARLRWRVAVWYVRSYALMFIWIPCVIAGAKVPMLPLMVLGIVLAVVDGFLIALAFMKLWQANRAAEAVLGLRLGFRHVAPPPREPKHYEDWCRRNGVTPYAAQASAPRHATA